MHKRITVLFSIITLMMTFMIYRVYYIEASDYITMAAQVQGQYELGIATTRGTIYDRNFERLVNNTYRYVASVMSTPQAANALLEVAPEEGRESLLERLSDGLPFAMEVPDNTIYASGVEVFRVARRYREDLQYAPHVVGYLGDQNQGVAGIEKAYDDLLADAGGQIAVRYSVDATGRVMQGASVSVERQNEEAFGGVVLSLDREIQAITQEALAEGCDKGAAVVLDIYTGDILAMSSLPTFDQNDISASLDSEDAPFINRAISGYNIGSVFKLVVASAALENGLSRDYEYECQGAIDVSGQIFRCNNNAVHGRVDMERALQVSCNCYFIRITQEFEPEYLLSVAEYMGLGTSSELAPGIVTQAGNLPTVAELYNPAGYANFSFGQGSSLASPLQIAQAVACIANTGKTVTPRLVLGSTPDGATLTNPAPSYTVNQVLSESTARTVRELMALVVEEGSGSPAKPEVGGAGGKTSSAQTGQIVDDEEIVHAWFAGYYPADNPQYSIAVFVEGGESGEQVAAPIFKGIADGIGALDNQTALGQA